MPDYYLINPQTYDDQFWWKKDDIEFWKTVIPQYSKVLELAAGTARIGKPLVKSDIDYTGLELSSDYVSFANLKFPNHNPIIQGDMRKFSLNTKYDVILIGFNSLLHLLSEDEVSMCLDNIRSHMHNDTKLYIDIFVPRAEFLYRSPQSNLIVMEFFDSAKNHVSIIEESLFYDSASEIVSVNWQYKKKSSLMAYNSFDFQMKVYYPDTMNRLLIDAGFEIINLWGSYDKVGFEENSELQIYELNLF